MLDWIQNHLPPAQLVRTGILIIVLLLGRWVLLSRLARNDGLSQDLRRRWAAQVRLASFLLLLLGLTVIWGTELRTFALSVVAIAAAIVIATKELIMCVSGTLLKASGKSFQIGDRIEIGAVRGDVVDQTLLTTTVLEVGPGTSIHQHTGRTIVLPNSILLSTPVINETFSDDYVLHAFTVPLDESEHWRDAESALMAAARTECADFLGEAQRHMDELVRKQGLTPLSVEPRVTLRLEDPKKVVMLARIAVPARRKGRIEQAILRRFLDWRAAERARKADDGPSGAD